MIEVALKNKYLQFIDQNLIISRKHQVFGRLIWFFLTISSMFSIFLLAMFYWLNVFWPSHFYNWFLLLMLHSSSFYFDSYMHHILFSTSESTEKNQYNNFLKKICFIIQSKLFSLFLSVFLIEVGKPSQWKLYLINRKIRLI